eukprot:m.184588 g.184588  ORF g.184588 m.184588 type:complete len:972 (+) comp32197_c2_seq1:198-3113(+)
MGKAPVEIGLPTNVQHGGDQFGKKMPGETDDLTLLEELSEEVLLLELNVRYKKNQIYTYVGDILCAINPYMTIPGLYDQPMIDLYAGLVQLSDHPPHLFAMADAAYRKMSAGGGASGNSNQVCVISGESGAGKTESAKLFIKHIIQLSSQELVAGVESYKGLADQIVGLNPLLESLGNARTLMNDNSSRFGKFIDLWFNSERAITGATIRHYLLEKSRVIDQLDGEQNFHIFYMWFSGVADDLETYKLGDPMEHRIINSNEDAIDAIEEPKTKAMWDELVECFDIVGFTKEETNHLFHMIAGILHLGDVEFGGGDDPAFVVSTEDGLFKVSDQLSVDLVPLRSALVERSLTLKGETTMKQYNQIEAEDGRDALAKEIFNNLFSWVVTRVNALLAAGDGKSKMKKSDSSIGILDIFGFEVFEVNSFEQLLINLANEQLQFFFNTHIFAMEIAEYGKEGIDPTQVEFSDNAELLENMLLGKQGLLALCDEECKVPRGSDAGLLNKMHTNLAKYKEYVRPKGDALEFSIAHYAGLVAYDVQGFLDKNRDTLAVDLIAVMRLSTNPIIVALFGGGDAAGGKKKGRADKKALRASAKKVKKDQEKGNKKSLSQSFKASLTELMTEMGSSNPHFIRCLKPNLEKKPRLFKLEMVTIQLRYTGMLETTRIRKEGYSHRPTFEDFVYRYKFLSFGLSADPEPTASNCQMICDKAKLEGFQIGRTKVFLRHFHVGQLEQALLPFPVAALKVQCIAEYVSARKKFAILAEEKKKTEELVKPFCQNVSRNINGVHTILEALCEDDSRRPPDFFEVKRKNTSKIRDPTMKKMAKEANKSKHGITRAQSIKWFKEVEMKKGAGMKEGSTADSSFEQWFHGIISRNEATDLLQTCAFGAFLVRVAESRFGYSLSHYVSKGKVKHYMIDQTETGQYQVVGNAKLFASLNELVSWHQHVKVVQSDPVALLEPCGEANGNNDLQTLGL